MHILQIIKYNAKAILKFCAHNISFLFACIGVMLTFISLQDIGIKELWQKSLIFIVVITAGFAISIIWFLVFRKKKQLWSNGQNKVTALYGDLFSIAFKKKNNQKKIIVIPVNDTFETIVDEPTGKVAKPLVSSSTIHGMWIKKMVSNGIDIESLDKKIANNLKLRNITPVKKYSKKDKPRGKLESYELGTIAIVDGPNNVEFYLVAISEFDIDNCAQSSPQVIRNCIDAIIKIHKETGQGKECYIPIIGTGQSKAHLSHSQSFEIIKSSIIINESSINGSINIVIYTKDRDKVSIFE